MKKFVINSKHGRFLVKYDDGDSAIVKKYHWSVIQPSPRLFYVVNNQWNKGQQKSIYLHRLIMGFPKSQVDHINNDTLDNRRKNLRMATDGENKRNRRKTVQNRTGYKGVFIHSNENLTKRFRAQIVINKKAVHGGYFLTPTEAAKSYNKLALKYHGEFAKLNII